ncbi:sigma-70 region 4 domain-containing protein [Deinococcus sp. KNUC1210]|uniref:sigma-70 region 4 domain-containing protein n=1 Tax=Deinococcus sp. KNUC1210 TaxID=2917691 RepID=UPI001EF0BB3E|nr:sigma-70 region 4 domain-containing protein [Deinococcus sp. KNUC1210]ULH14467.1 sigma-70 region 4 domain-containing protein [Deinococcus sp. KNUC1210]
MSKIRKSSQQEVVAAHMQGFLHYEIAGLLGISVSTVKRRLSGLNLTSNHRSNRLGKEGEALMAATLRSKGVAVETMPNGHPFDLLVAGWRVDVKTTGTLLDDGGFKFWLPNVRPSFRAAYRYPKNYQRDTDFIVLTFLQGGDLLYTYVVPAQFWKPSIRIHPASLFEPLREYRDAWALLEARPAAA